MSSLAIRGADPDADAAACAAIYAPHVKDGPVSFEERAPDAEELAGRIRRLTPTHPWLVAEQDEEVVGFAYACPHGERAAYRWSTDVSIYLAADHVGQGIGRALYEELFERLRAQRFRIACAGITLPNPASVALHERLGFAPVGVYREIGWKDGGWRDVAWYQMELAPPTADPPLEPLPPS